MGNAEPTGRAQTKPLFKRTLVDLPTAAEHLGVTTHTLRRWISDGRIRAYRVGGSPVRLDVADVEALVKPIPTWRDTTGLDDPCTCGSKRITWFQRRNGAVCTSCQMLRYLG